MKKTFPSDEVHLVYEAGCCGFSEACCFLNIVWHVLVVDSADVKTENKDCYQKTDAFDSNNLSNQLKKEVLKGINIPIEE
jgi:transposase